MDSYFKEAVDFLRHHQYIWDIKLTEFFVYKPYLSMPKEYLDSLSYFCDNPTKDKASEKIGTKFEWDPGLIQYYQTTQKLSVDRRQTIDAIPIPHSLSSGLSPKKAHEISQLSTFLHNQIKALNKGREVVVVDIGSGLGYLGQMLHSLFKYYIINVEGVKSYCEGSEKRERKSLNDMDTSKFISHINIFLMDDKKTFSGFYKSVKDIIGQWSESFETKPFIVLTGLHSCADLIPTMLKLFENGKYGTDQSSDDSPISFDLMVAVGCCYHRMAERVDQEICYTSRADGSMNRSFKNFPMSLSLSSSMNQQEFSLNTYGLRLGAQETLNRWHRQSHVDRLNHKNYLGLRGVLEKALLESELSSFLRQKGNFVRGKDSFKNFHTFKVQLKNRLKIQTWNQLEEFLDKCYDDLVTDFQYIEPFTFLQFCLQGVIESLILQDRKQWLIEHGIQCELVPIFDDILSPRNIAIFAC